MSEATVVTYDVHRPDRPVAGADPERYPFSTAASRPFLVARPGRQVREDESFYIPDFLSEKSYDANPKAYAAAAEHAKHLREVERALDEAVNLIRLLMAALGDQGDSRSMQTQTGLKVVEKKLNKAHNRIDRHDTRHTNLFLAYFDLKDKTNRDAD